MPREVEGLTQPSSVTWVPVTDRLGESGAETRSSVPSNVNAWLTFPATKVAPFCGVASLSPAMSTAYFRFTAPVPERSLDVVLLDGPAYLIDIDPDSPERGSKLPILAKTLLDDAYAADNLVALAPRPGIVMRAEWDIERHLREYVGAENWMMPPASSSVIVPTGPLGGPPTLIRAPSTRPQVSCARRRSRAGASRSALSTARPTATCWTTGSRR